ncbi:MAG: transcriptional activator RfaH [Alphaproteobacteria bacterium]|nr:transcriptional activator RfaH [Alphaproteobacteria bacterium]
MMRWCVAHTQPVKENLAGENLKDQGFEIYLPKIRKIRRHARSSEEVLTPLFPRYIFVGMDLESTPWRSINGTRGISYLLMRDRLHPAHIPSRTIQELRSQEIEEGIVPITSLVTFSKGDKVRIVEGVFKDQTAIFESLDDRNRVQVLLNFLGRETKVSLLVHAVEAA